MDEAIRTVRASEAHDMASSSAPGTYSHSTAHAQTSTSREPTVKLLPMGTVVSPAVGLPGGVSRAQPDQRPAFASDTYVPAVLPASLAMGAIITPSPASAPRDHGWGKYDVSKSTRTTPSMPSVSLGLQALPPASTTATNSNASTQQHLSSDAADDNVPLLKFVSEGDQLGDMQPTEGTPKEAFGGLMSGHPSVSLLGEPIDLTHGPVELGGLSGDGGLLHQLSPSFPGLSGNLSPFAGVPRHGTLTQGQSEVWRGHSVGTLQTYSVDALERVGTETYIARPLAAPGGRYPGRPQDTMYCGSFSHAEDAAAQTLASLSASHE